MPRTGNSLRVGITGVPGVGKSTFIERLGTMLTARGERVAVLAIDPSSGRTGGSILGDKTRMAKLSADDRAFIRPSPSAGTLGGVARKTRETMLLCEAAGYSVVLVETVGVGQSETLVAGMTDALLGLMLPGAGDELQGIKRGILELLDVIAVNKADGDNAPAAKRAASELRAALRIMTPHDVDPPGVLTCSAATGDGLDRVWEAVEARVGDQQTSGVLAERRRAQSRTWLWEQVEDTLRREFHTSPAVADLKADIERRVAAGEIAASTGAEALLRAFRSGTQGEPESRVDRPESAPK